MPDYGDMKLVNEQMRKAAGFFGRVLAHHKMGKLAARVDDVAILVVRGEESIVWLERLLTDDGDGEQEPFLPLGFSFDREHSESIDSHDSIDSHEGLGSQTSSPESQTDDEPPVALEPRYHVPGSQVYPGSRGAAVGNVHLHVSADVKLGRRSRKAGECLCSKKHGSFERKPEGETKMCDECVKVAADNGLTWSL